MNYNPDRPGIVLVTGKACYPEGVALSGTVTSSGTLVTGTGTKFLTELFLSPENINIFPFAVTDQGNWNASTNSPALVGSVGTEGYQYTVSVAGSTNLDGKFDWAVGDKLAFYQGKWVVATKYNRFAPIRYKYLWSKTNNQLLEIIDVMSDTTLLVKVAPNSALAGEAFFVAGLTPDYKAISISPQGAGGIMGTINQLAVTLDENTIVTFDKESGLLPICVDGTTGSLQISTQY